MFPILRQFTWICRAAPSECPDLNRSELMCLQCQWPGWLLYFCVDMGGLVYMKESWRLMGGRVNGMLWGLEEEEGRRGEELFIG